MVCIELLVPSLTMNALVWQIKCEGRLFPFLQISLKAAVVNRKRILLGLFSLPTVPHGSRLSTAYRTTARVRLSGIRTRSLLTSRSNRKDVKRTQTQPRPAIIAQPSTLNPQLTAVSVPHRYVPAALNSAPLVSHLRASNHQSSLLEFARHGTG